MTDLATEQQPATDATRVGDSVSASSAADGASTDSTAGSGGDRPVEWAPAEPPRKKRRLGLWIGLGVGVLALGAGAASTILIAPGVTVAGVPIGGMTVGAAAEALSARVSDIDVTLTGADKDITVSGSDLGARIDAQGLAEAAFAAHPMWNVTSWLPDPVAGDVELDPATTDRVLRAEVPSSYTAAVDASVVFDPASKTYTTTPGENGTGIDVPALSAAFAEAVAAGDKGVTFDAGPTTVEPPVTQKDAQAFADSLNAMLGTVGFYVGTERTVPVAPEVAARWLSVSAVDGELQVDVDRAAIQQTVDSLPGVVNRAPVNAEAIVNSAGEVLDTVTEGVNGRELGDTSHVAADFANQLAKDANGVFTLPVKEVPFTADNRHRVIDVNLATQTVTAVENGNAVNSWSVSSGRDEFATQTGNYAVNWKLSSQDMGNKDTTKAPYYFQPDVKWVMYFNGDEALHGVYWHSNWGTPMSHGCVGMPEDAAQWLYNWSPEGVEVNVHY
ncbi:L,D-transpeptidase family protein [Microbacterium resistens]|uniref:L,D-transpeptidase family protein n=1 Tax=Microbacterium resistens TaxID=156977 RepID=A0ABY3RW03_9MICO|nr:L,D-transpeptidase family protein [Microbacterium resistens]MBW1640396.1 L,D-transpeptidase family protein [Microbacterium resistens]MDA4893574.1 L,D-transpeptidase family protein [Streptomyces sp. MS2A]UGS28248.1 L,D-transpeptidase family protein [Microbacterium resistens]